MMLSGIQLDDVVVMENMPVLYLVVRHYTLLVNRIPGFACDFAARACVVFFVFFHNISHGAHRRYRTAVELSVENRHVGSERAV